MTSLNFENKVIVNFEFNSVYIYNDESQLLAKTICRRLLTKLSSYKKKKNAVNIEIIQEKVLLNSYTP